MRLAAHVGAAYLVVLLGGAVWRITPFELCAPDVPLVFALYLGIVQRSPLAQTTASLVVLGYLVDVLSGAPRGLSPVVLGLACIAARVVTGRLLVRGRLMVAGFAFVASTLATLLVLGMRVYFGTATGTLWRETVVLVGSALLTAIAAPMVFRLCRRIDARFARTEREREALREGYLS